MAASVARLRRIVLALEDPEHLQPTLGDAAALAVHVQGELVGLLIEDEELRQFADLPFAREIVRSSAIPRMLDSDRLERQLRVRAERIRRAFQRIETEQRLHTSLRIVRGRQQAQHAATEQPADVIFVASRRRAAAPGEYPGIRAGHAGAPLAVLYDHSPCADRALEVAAALHTGHAGPLLVLLGESPETGRPSTDESRDALSARLSRTDFRVLPLAHLDAPEQLAIRYRCRLLVLPARGDRPERIVAEDSELTGLPIALVT